MIAFVIQGNNSFTTICRDFEGKLRKDSKTVYRNPVFINELNPLVVNRKDKRDYFRYNTDIMKATDCSSDEPSNCLPPKFMVQMDDSLFQSIDGIIRTIESMEPIGFQDFLLLFNIEGRPKLCVTPLLASISEQVRH